MHFVGPPLLIGELPVGICAEESLSHCRESFRLQQAQPLFKGIVDVDFSVTADDADAASPEKVSRQHFP